MDQWEMVTFYQAWLDDRQPRLSLLLAQHNDHRLPFTRLAFLADYAIFQARSILVAPLLLLVQTGLGAALGWLATQGRAAGERALAAALGVAAMLAPLHIENLALPFNLQWPLCGLLSLAAVHLAARLAGAAEFRPATVLLCAIAIVGSVYSSANGIATAACVVAMTFALPVTAMHRVLITAVAVAAIATYVPGFAFPEHHKPVFISFASTDTFRQFFLYLGAYLGSFAHHFGTKAAVLTGLSGLCGWLALTLILALYRRQTFSSDPAAVALLFLAAAAIASAAMTAFGRLGFGLEQAQSSRYAAWALLFWLCLLGAVYRLTADLIWAKAAVLLGTVAIIVMSFISGQKPLAEGRVVAQMLGRTSAAILSGEPANLQPLYPDARSVAQRIEFLRLHGLSIFAEHADSAPR